MDIWDDIHHFTPDEFGAHADRMSEDLLLQLDYARHEAGLPFIVTSTYREGDAGAHGDGDAVDISDNSVGDDIGSMWRFVALRGLYAAGFTRIGIYDKHIHADVSRRLPDEVSWIGKSS